MEKHKEPYYPATRPGSTSYRTGSQGQNNPSGTRSAHAHSEAWPKPDTDLVRSLARYSALLFYSNSDLKWKSVFLVVTIRYNLQQHVCPLERHDG